MRRHPHINGWGDDGIGITDVAKIANTRDGNGWEKPLLNGLEDG